MKAYGRVKVQLHYFKTSGPDGSKWVFLKPRPLYPRVGACGTLWLGDCMGPTARL